MDSWRIEVYQDDSDVLAKSVLVSPDGEEWEVLVVTAAPGAITNPYFPDVIECVGPEKRLIVAFDGGQIQQKLHETVTEATLELETVDNAAMIGRYAVDAYHHNQRFDPHEIHVESTKKQQNGNFL